MYYARAYTHVRSHNARPRLRDTRARVYNNCVTIIVVKKWRGGQWRLRTVVTVTVKCGVVILLNAAAASAAAVGGDAPSTNDQAPR